MCGITGWLGPTRTLPQPEESLRLMRDSLLHRGPDEAGDVLLDGAALAMRRLSVIDLSGGSQPMISPCGKCWLIQNGEIYNFRELRSELEGKGHQFSTDSDTEVLLHAYLAWGVSFLERVRGMFSIAIYDCRSSALDSGTLLLARDRFGKKPLYYSISSGFLVFGSEPKALLKHPFVPKGFNQDALAEYLTHGYTFSSQTLFLGIRELPPGSYLTASGKNHELVRYWQPDFPRSPAPRKDDAELLLELRSAIRDAVLARLVSDVPLGAFLSGGLDSAIIVAEMASHCATPVRTFSIGFEGDGGFDELPHARVIAERYATEHHEFVVTPDTFKELATLLDAHDLPFGDSSSLPTLLLSRLTRQHVTVALSGDGGDELFAGYERFTGATSAAMLYNLLPSPLQTVVSAALHALPESSAHRGLVSTARRFADAAPLPIAERYLSMVGIFPYYMVRNALTFTPNHDPVAHYVQLFEEVSARDSLEQILYMNCISYLAGDLLPKVDRCSMACSLEVRSPFLDDRLFSLVRTIPSSLKLRRWKTKYILKKAYEPVLPESIVHRQKHGFGVPIGSWFRTSMKHFLLEILRQPGVERDGFIKPGFAENIVQQHLSGKMDHSSRIWTLVTLELWYRKYFA